MTQYANKLKPPWITAAVPSNNNALAQRVTAQAIDFLYRNMPSVIISITLMPMAMILIMWRHIDQRVLIAWCVASFAVTAARLLLNRAYLQRTPPPQAAPRWGRYYTWTALASGLVWGGAGILFFVPDSTAHQVFLFTSIVGLCAGSIILNSYWLESYYAFSLPALSLSSARMLMEGSLAYQGLAALALMLGIVLFQVAHRTRKSALAAMRLRFENIDLVEQLRAEKDKAETASHDKTRFLAAASHDLRQPVHALTLFTNALHAEQTSDKGKELLSDMGHSIHALNQLLESLIDISKLDADIVKPAPGHFALQPLLDRLHAEYLPQAHAKGLDWKTHAHGLVVHSDPVLLEAILRNLISNAIRYTRAGRIEIICTHQGAEARIEVFDTGIGIPHAQQREIFREFYQLSNPERDRSKGLGLGLAIVERLASLLNHRIELKSELGQGSRFAIVLPVGDAAAITNSMAAAIVLSQHDLSGMRIMVIDDEVAVRKGMRAVLEDWGSIALLAGSEDEALDMLKHHAPPDVIIADYRLRNDRTGVQAIERLRRATGIDISALIVTGDTAPERMREARASGYTLMHKPVQLGKLRAYLQRVRRREKK